MSQYLLSHHPASSRTMRVGPLLWLHDRPSGCRQGEEQSDNHLKCHNVMYESTGKEKQDCLDSQFTIHNPTFIPIPIPSPISSNPSDMMLILDSLINTNLV